MFGILGAALGVATTILGNDAADSRAASANAANTEAADRSRALSEKNAADRKAELLKRFKIKSSKVKDASQQINTATATKLTNLDMQINKARSATDNASATKHLTGRLTERLKNVQAIQGSLSKGTILQAGEAQNKEVGSKLETLTMDVESEQMNLNIDLSNSINAANNAEVRGYTYSTSSGIGGVMSSAVSGAASGLNLATSYNNYKASIG